jgi:hypothetical protein
MIYASAMRSTSWGWVNVLTVEKSIHTRTRIEVLVWGGAGHGAAKVYMDLVEVVVRYKFLSRIKCYPYGNRIYSSVH